MKCLILVLLIFISNLCHGQEKTDYLYKILYAMEFRLDSTSSVVTKERTELLYQDGISFFWLSKNVFRDTAILHATSYDIGPTTTNQKFRIFKDHNLNRIRYYDVYNGLTGETFFYDEVKDSLQWTITDETDSINGFFCQKANLSFGNRLWEAWFTADIPIQDGPYKFCNLPGLIVRVYDSSNSWRFNLMEIKKEEKRTLKIGVNKLFLIAKPIEKAMFYKDMRHFMDNEIQIQEAQGFLQFPNETIRKRANDGSKANAKKNNNWIELYP